MTNGDQTDTIYDLMSQGKSFADALRTRTFEPDGPNYTPRISAVVYADGSYQMSHPQVCRRQRRQRAALFLWITPQPVAGEGHSSAPTSTMAAPIPQFLRGEPLRFACPQHHRRLAHGRGAA